METPLTPRVRKNNTAGKELCLVLGRRKEGVPFGPSARARVSSRESEREREKGSFFLTCICGCYLLMKEKTV